MPASVCLQNIISIKDPCDPLNTPQSLSGFDLFDLPGLTYKSASQVADSDYVSGLNMLRDKRRLAILKIKNEIFTWLQYGNYIPNSNTDIYRTGELRRMRDSKVIPASTGNGKRGAVVYGTNPPSALKKVRITDVYIKSDYTGNTKLYVEDGATTYEYLIALNAGKINAISLNFSADTDEVRLVLADNIPVYSVDPNCSCGDKKSSYAKTAGIDSGATNTQESFGIWADVSYSCDLDYLLCQLSRNTIFGEMMLYLTGALVMDERLKTDRLNYFTIYGQEEAEKIKDEWMLEYGSKWNTLIQSLPNLLPKMDHSGCIQCKGVRIASNI